jgi:hypothetical protein
VGGSVGDLLAYAATVNPATGDIYVFGNFDMRRWTRSSNAWGDPNPSGAHPYGYESLSAYGSTRNRILILGGTNNDEHLYTVSTNSFSSVNITGTSAGAVAGAEGATMVYVPPMDVYLVRTAGSGGTVHQISAGGFVATSYPTTGGGSIPATQNGPYNKFLYVPRLGGVIYVPSYSGNAWFLRLH